jgi:hypothetical protein
MVQFKGWSIYGELKAFVDSLRAMGRIVLGLSQILLSSSSVMSKHQGVFLFAITLALHNCLLRYHLVICSLHFAELLSVAWSDCFDLKLVRSISVLLSYWHVNFHVTIFNVLFPFRVLFAGVFCICTDNRLGMVMSCSLLPHYTHFSLQCSASSFLSFQEMEVSVMCEFLVLLVFFLYTTLIS